MENKIAVVEMYCELTPTSLRFKREVTEQEWQKVFNSLTLLDKCVHFWIGDCLAYKKQQWGMYDELADKTGFDKTTLMNDKYISQQIESSLRREDLSFTHHAIVASLIPEEQDKWLKRASEEKLTVKELREEIKKENKVILPLPEGKYNVVYADPPWKYDIDLSNGATRSPENHYPVMDLDELKEFGEEVKKLSTDNCVLFLWITAPKLNWLNDVLEAWGFIYKTNLIWDKIKPNMGHYSSVRHEILIIAGKGNSAPLCDGKTIQSIDSVQSIEKTEHSEKPTEFRTIIEKLYPNQKYIELFARGKAPDGWIFWGKEANGD